MPWGRGGRKKDRLSESIPRVRSASSFVLAIVRAAEGTYHPCMQSDGIRKRNLYDPASVEPYRLSRSKVELFLQCPRCFYLDRRLGVSRPEGPAFSLNNTVDLLLKREFDAYRLRREAHNAMVEHG